MKQYSAHKTKEGTHASPIWEYRGFKMRGRKNPGWNSGSMWTATKTGSDGVTSGSKQGAMDMIDRMLDLPKDPFDR